MKKIENIIESCRECRHCQKYVSNVNYGEVWFCGHDDLDKCDDRDHFIAIAGKSAISPTPVIPAWCPLQTYEDAEKYEARPEAASCNIGQSKSEEKARDTIILPGMPNLEWMTENLSGHGGTEIDGRTYYTYDQAVEAVKQLGDGWRLPTRGEMVDLDDLGSEWQENGPHGLPGRLFGGDLFFDAAGHRHRETGALAAVGAEGNYASSSSYAAGNVSAGTLWFGSGNVNPLSSTGRANGLSVRCVRNVK